MNNPSSHLASSRISTRRAGLVLCLTLACSLFAGGIRAQVLVTDVANESSAAATDISTGKSLVQQGYQYAKQLEQYQQQIAQYEQLLNTVQGLGTNISFSQNQLQLITDPSSLIDQNCPSAGGSIVSTMVTSIASAVSPTQSITASQHQLCAQITMVQIDEYNKTVSIANLLGTYGGTVQKLNALANAVNSIGTTSGATTQAATYSATVATAMNNWQSQVAGDQKLIDALNQQQGILARVAMRGQNTPLGNVIQAGALAAWFSANKYSQNNKLP